MKSLIYVGAALLTVVAIGVLALLVLGARSDQRIASTIDIAQPPDVVFEWVTEPQRLQSWVGWLIEVRRVTPDQGRISARQLWVMEDRNNNNQRMNIESEVVTYRHNELLHARLTSPGAFTGSVEYALQPLESGRTRLSYAMAYDYEYWLAQFLEPIIARSAQQKLEEDLARLKQKAEADAAGFAQGK